MAHANSSGNNIYWGIGSCTPGRICFCKGESGYFPVRKGKLFVYQNEGDLLVRASFSVPKIPQIIEEIDERLTYYPRP